MSRPEPPPVAETCHRCHGWIWHRRWPCECKTVGRPQTSTPDWLRAIGQRLRACRCSRKLTLDELADRCGMSKTGLWEIEAGKHEPMARTLVALSAALEVTTDYLLLLVEP